MKFTEEVRGIVLERSQGYCELCGLSVMGRAEYHHRRPRGMGGSKDPAVGTAANCLLLHPRCHLTVESYREKGKRTGFLVTQQDNPEEVPLRRWDGWVLLGEDGKMTPVDPPLPEDQNGAGVGDDGEDYVPEPTT